MEKQVTNNDLTKLRQQGLIENNEVALLVGDVIIAENVITKQRRVLELGTVLLESNRRILRD